jgi:hypothetical protein
LLGRGVAVKETGSLRRVPEDAVVAAAREELSSLRMFSLA